MSVGRTRLTLAVVIALAVAATATIVMLVDRAQSSGKARVTLAQTQQKLQTMQGLPWTADPRSGMPFPSDLAQLHELEAAVDASVTQLEKLSPPAEFAKVRGLVRTNYDALVAVYTYGVQHHGWGVGPQTAALQDRANKPFNRATAIFGRTSDAYLTRANRAGYVALGGTIAAIALLVSAFAFFFRRSARVTAEQERTLAKLRQAQAERAHLLERTVQVAEHERIRVAMDLHDGPIQALTAVAFKLDLLALRITRGDVDRMAESLDAVRADLAQQMGSLRRLMSDLRPPILDEGGVAAALRDCAGEVLADSGIEWTLDTDVDDRFQPELETVIYRVAREALLNVRRHSNAQRVEVVLERRDDLLHLEVSDNGDGFEAARTDEALESGRYGLLGMKERVESISGEWKLESAPGEGTRCHAVLPWHSRVAPAAAVEGVQLVAA